MNLATTVDANIVSLCNVVVSTARARDGGIGRLSWQLLLACSCRLQSTYLCWVMSGGVTFWYDAKAHRIYLLPKSIPLITHQSTTWRCLLPKSLAVVEVWWIELAFWNRHIELYRSRHYSASSEHLLPKDSVKNGARKSPTASKSRLHPGISTNRSNFDQNTIRQPLESAFQDESIST